MSEQIGKVSLKALQAYTRDVGKNIVRIDSKTMEILGVSGGAILEICGNRKTASKCMQLYASDVDRGITRIDGLIRKNVNVSIGDTVVLNRAEPRLAEKVVLASVKGAAHLDSQYVVEVLNGSAFTLGDMVLVPFGLEWKLLIALDAEPKSNVYVIGSSTGIELLPSVI